MSPGGAVEPAGTADGVGTGGGTELNKESLGLGVAGGAELDHESLGLGMAGGTELDGGVEGVAVALEVALEVVLGVELGVVAAVAGVVPRCVAGWCAVRGARVALGLARLTLLSGSAGAAAVGGDVGAGAATLTAARDVPA